MNELLTPKQVARAIDVSESSVKRWCDKGVIATQYTAGKHRRILLGSLLEFLRSTGHAVVRPEVLGLPAVAGQSQRVIDRGAEQLTDALLRGDEEQVRRIVLDLYLAEHSPSSICDLVIAKAFAAIGDKWQCGEAEVYQERLACTIVQRVLDELRSLAPTPPPGAPKAIGGAVEGDPYNLATSMAELVLRDARWNAVSLGSNLPFATLAAAIKEHRPQLFWLSCSHVPDEAEFVQGYMALYNEFGRDVAFAVGGRALIPNLRQEMKYATFCDNLRHLEAFVQSSMQRVPLA